MSYVSAPGARPRHPRRQSALSFPAARVEYVPAPPHEASDSPIRRHPRLQPRARPVAHTTQIHASKSLRVREGSPARGYFPASSTWSTPARSEEHTSELQSLRHLVCRLLLEKK